MKKINITLPKIEGVELKNATIDLENGVVIAEYGERTLCIKVKKGDVIYQNSPECRTPMIIIVGEDATIMEGVNDISTCIAMIGSRGGVYFNDDSFGTHGITELRFATESEKQTLFDALKEKGKIYNPETFKIDDLNISQIMVTVDSARDYLGLNQFGETFDDKLEALRQLMTIAKAWNKFDEFEPDWEDSGQKKYSPTFEFINGRFEFLDVWSIRFASDTHISNFSFKTKKRAEQFGKQFIELFRIVLTN